MKKIRLLCLFLSLVLVLPIFAACNNKGNEEDPTASFDETSDLIAGIEKKSYDSTFLILAPESELFVDYYWEDDIAEATSNISYANYIREIAIEEYLGVDIYQQTFAQKEGLLFQQMQTIELAGEDVYQLIMTHCFQDLANIMITGLVQDLSTVPGISMNDEYWNNDIMESVEYKDRRYLGSSSFILHSPTMMIFNKEMADSIDGMGTQTLYQHVREKTWTIEQFQQYMEMVNISMNDSLSSPLEGTYGFVSSLNWEIVGFQAASGYVHVEKDGDGVYQLRNFNDDVFSIFQAMDAVVRSPYSYGWSHTATAAEKISMETGRALFSALGCHEIIPLMLNSEIELGVLPFPTIESGMEYKSFDWSGYFMISNTVTNLQMSGEVVELFSYYGKTKIEHEFYDVLLGLRASQKPEDKEMMELIFSNLIVDPALTFANGGASSLANMFFKIPYMLFGGNRAMASSYSIGYAAAKNQLDRMNA